ncbi:MAG: NAD-dependent epimerase/dehydratase family protein [Sedimenticola sp.]
MANVLLTGGNGYIGTNLIPFLLSEKHHVRLAVRSKSDFCGHKNIECCLLGDLVEISDWSEILQGIDYVIHLAARAHVINESSRSPLELYGKVNSDLTLRLAQMASELNIKRFVYVSSIGVLGNSTLESGFFDNRSPYNPQEAYAVSKMEAEIGLQEISDSTALEVAIVRPPLVYGPGAPGNFHRLLRLVDLGLPLPFGSMKVRKSLISVANLSSLLVQCISTPLPRFSKFVVSDGSDWSTADLVRLIADQMGKKITLLPVPVPFLEMVAFLFGRSKDVQKLSTQLLVDGGETAKILGWKTVQFPKDGVKEAVDYYLAHKIQGR